MTGSADARALLFGCLGIGVFTWLYRQWPQVSNATTVALSFLVVVLFVAAAARLWVAVTTSVVSVFALNFFFLPPVGTLTIVDPQNWIALFAFLAAVYLTIEAEDGPLQEDFRLRALVAGVVVGLLALIVFVLAGSGAPTLRAGISRSSWALALHILTAAAAIGAFYTLWTRRYMAARVCAATQVTLILLGWAFAQYPYLIEPDISLTSAAAPQITLQLLLGALIAGAILLFPSYYYLFRIFKTTE